jgi:predicted lipid-binding transport protein (Tim44 family)
MAAVTATIFFAPGVLALFLAFAGVLHGGVLGVILAGVATGALAGFIGGLTGHGIARLACGLLCAATASRNSKTQTDTAAKNEQKATEGPITSANSENSQAQADAPVEDEQKATEGQTIPPNSGDSQSQPDTCPATSSAKDGDTPVAVKAQAGGDAQGSTRLPLDRFFFPTDGTARSVDNKDARSEMLERIQRRVPLRHVAPPVTTPLGKAQTQRELFAADVADRCFGGKVPDRATDPLRHAEYEARTNAAVAYAELQDAGKRAGAEAAVILSKEVAQQKYDATQQKIKALEAQQRIAAAMTEWEMDGDALRAKMEQLDRLIELNALARKLQGSIDVKRKIITELQLLGLNDPDDVAPLLKACNAMIDTYSPRRGMQISQEAADKFHADISKFRQEVASLPNLVQFAKEAILSEGLKLEELPGLEEFFELLVKPPTIEELSKIKFNTTWSARLKSSEERFNCLRETVEHMHSVIVNTRAATETNSNKLFTMLTTVPDPAEFVAKLESLGKQIKQHANEPEDADQLDNLTAEIEKFRSEIGDEETIAGLENLRKDIGRQEIIEHLAAIEKYQKPSDAPAVDGEFVSTIANPQTEAGKWLAVIARREAGANQNILISGHGENLNDEEIAAYERIVDHLTYLAEKDQLPLTPELLAKSEWHELCELLHTANSGKVETEELHERINKAINARNPEALVQAIFDDESW